MSAPLPWVKLPVKRTLLDRARETGGSMAQAGRNRQAGPRDRPRRSTPRSSPATLVAVPAGPARIRIPSGFNRAVLAADALGGRPVALASEATGTGHTLGDLDAAILLELAEGGSAALAQRVDARLARGGRSLQRDGQPVNDQAERTALVGQACDAFRTTLLPGIMRLGIATEA